MPSSGEKKLEQQRERRRKDKERKELEGAPAEEEAISNALAVFNIDDEQGDALAKRCAELRGWLAKLLEELKVDHEDYELPSTSDDHSKCTSMECKCLYLGSRHLQPLGGPQCPVLYSMPVRYRPEWNAEMHYWMLTDELNALQAGLLAGDELAWDDAFKFCVMAQKLAESMRAVQDPTGEWILPHRASYEVKYVAAALALRCGQFVDSSGTLMHRAAAKAFHAALCGDIRLNNNASAAVKGWLEKLQKLEQACYDAYASDMESERAAAGRFLEEGKVAPQRVPYFTMISQRTMKVRTRSTPAYELLERRVVGGGFDWDLEQAQAREDVKVWWPSYLLQVAEEHGCEFARKPATKPAFLLERPR